MPVEGDCCCERLLVSCRTTLVRVQNGVYCCADFAVAVVPLNRNMWQLFLESMGSRSDITEECKMRLHSESLSKFIVPTVVGYITYIYTHVYMYI